MLALPNQVQQPRIPQAHPNTSLLQGGARPTEHRLSQYALVRRVITDHPLPPKRRCSVEVEHRPSPTLRGPGNSARRGIERDPSIARKVGLHPGVGIPGPDHVVPGQVVETNLCSKLAILTIRGPRALLGANGLCHGLNARSDMWRRHIRYPEGRRLKSRDL